VSAANDPGSGADPLPEEVVEQADAVLLRVVAAGRVAEVLRPLLLTQQRIRSLDQHRPDGDRERLLERLAWRSAQIAVEATVHEDRSEVSHAAVGAAYHGAPDLTALVLAELASLHLRIGHLGELPSPSGAGRD
jgi:hypothetical protein